MADQHFNWSLLPSLLSTSSTIPTNITFKVVDKEEQEVAMLEAHKMIVALHSDHFRNAFYGSGTKFKEGKEGVMVIKETTKEAFEDFLGFLYEKKIDFKTKNLEELYEILNLAERYQVDELKDRVTEVFKNFPITLDNVVEVAATTELFSHFEVPSKDLYSSCVALMEKKFETVGSLVHFIQSNEDKATVMTLLNDIKKENCPKKCSNCQNDPCLNNLKVYLPSLRTGTLIKTDLEPSWTNDYHSHLVLRVLEIHEENVKIQCVNLFEPRTDYLRHSWIEHHLFACREANHT